jgi:hypothetical protein
MLRCSICMQIIENRQIFWINLYLRITSSKGVKQREREREREERRERGKIKEGVMKGIRLSRKKHWYYSNKAGVFLFLTIDLPFPQYYQRDSHMLKLISMLKSGNHIKLIHFFRYILSLILGLVSMRKKKCR